MIKRILLCAILFLLAPPTPSWGEEACTVLFHPLTKKKDIAFALNVLKRQYPDEIPSFEDQLKERGEFKIAYVDLNLDGQKEMILLAELPTRCGNPGCDATILQRRGNKWVRIGGGLMPEFGVEVRSPPINGWRYLTYCETRDDTTLVYDPKLDSYHESPELNRKIADGRPYCRAVTCTHGHDCPPEYYAPPPPPCR
ncbi:hypothetical protein CU669_13145 [Paramagnetospirillum kuznetsovii]|uniref:Lipoprotein n=1 Tax=Paramagnetospirillum kuznetsovii TaxID=2053833 RepID=A0A364NWU8_9PROT|nr:hypothetical protein [Paramagnetospirillum kuznetsovii]RAU21375.1 hypothetical protein CU669_13145 [Paramagnetospirillum kuznetsovii]